MKIPLNSPQIYRDHSRLYLDFGSHVQPFPFTREGLEQCLRAIPWMPGSREEMQRQLKPSWAIQGRDKQGKFVKPSRARPKAVSVANASSELKSAMDELVSKMHKKGEPKP